MGYTGVYVRLLPVIKELHAKGCGPYEIIRLLPRTPPYIHPSNIPCKKTLCKMLVQESLVPNPEFVRPMTPQESLEDSIWWQERKAASLDRRIKRIFKSEGITLSEAENLTDTNLLMFVNFGRVCLDRFRGWDKINIPQNPTYRFTYLSEAPVG